MNSEERFSSVIADGGDSDSPASTFLLFGDSTTTELVVVTAPTSKPKSQPLTLATLTGSMLESTLWIETQISAPKTYWIDVGIDFGKLLESGKGTDVTFEVDGETFSAHKLVLATRSPVFRAQLFGPMKDQNTQCIQVEDMEASVFKALLHFIHWDSLPNMQELTGLNSKWASTLMAQHLLAAADRYSLERLRLLCEASLCEDVAINTVATTLALAEQHHCLQLKSVCLQFVAMPENLRAVMQTEGFDYLKQSCPSVLTELLEYVAKVTEHNLNASKCGNEAVFDGSDNNGRRVKQRL